MARSAGCVHSPISIHRSTRASHRGARLRSRPAPAAGSTLGRHGRPRASRSVWGSAGDVPAVPAAPAGRKGGILAVDSTPSRSQALSRLLPRWTHGVPRGEQHWGRARVAARQCPGRIAAQLQGVPPGMHTAAGDARDRWWTSRERGSSSGSGTVSQGLAPASRAPGTADRRGVTMPGVRAGALQGYFFARGCRERTGGFRLGDEAHRTRRNGRSQERPD
jgi:hypothetical protein